MERTGGASSGSSEMGTPAPPAAAVNAGDAMGIMTDVVENLKLRSVPALLVGEGAAICSAAAVLAVEEL